MAEQAMTERILEFFRQNPSLRVKPKRLRILMRVSQKDYNHLRDTVKNLVRLGKLERFHGNAFGLPDRGQKPQNFTGVLDIHAKGFGFVNTAEGKKIFIHADNLGNANHGDTVNVRLLRRQSGENPEGYVRRTLTRGRSEFVCIFREVRGYSLGIPETAHLRRDVVITDFNGFEPADGSIVSVQITDWKDRSHRPNGRITRLIGSRDTREFDAVLVANQYRIPDRFPADVLEQAESAEFGIPDDGRADFRGLNTFTIDPEDAKDFDDALSISALPDGGRRLGVHIADVSYYVPEGSPLDREARRRGTSVYFTRHVIPMLPERLSNELCSLNPDTDRLAFSCVMDVDASGQVVSSRITPSVIHSCRRFSYEEAQAAVDTGKGDYAEEIRMLYDLARQLYRKRFEAGSIDFDIPEPKYVLDDRGFPVEIHPRERLWSHRLVEECMLLANRTVAAFIQRRNPQPPFIYRVHENPKPDDTMAFFRLMKSFGFETAVKGKKARPSDFRDALLEIRDSEVRYFMEKIALRTMTKARYDVRPLGHFGLAFEEYTHFTSPIRRYPDLLVHRMLRKYLKGMPKGDTSQLKERLVQLAKTSTDCEIRAMEAEREYHKIKQLKFLENKVGETFQGIVSGLVQYGFYVEIPEFLVEGFVHKRFLPSDWWEYDPRVYTLTGRRTRRVFRMGDHLTVQVVRVSLEHMEVDFRLIED